MRTDRELEDNGHVAQSLPPTHAMLILLDEMKGRPVAVGELSDKLSAKLAQRDGLLSEYGDIDVLVEEDLQYLERLRFVERVSTANGQGVRISCLGSLMALGLQAEVASR